MNMKLCGKWLGAAVAVGLSLVANEALALNYHELEVYPYKTAAKGELELENSSAFTNRGTNVISEDSPGNNQGLFRNSFEVSYGVTDKTEVAVYADVSRAQGANWAYDGQRYRARTRFFEKGELPVDLGAYVELELPKHDVDSREVELRGIVEKDFGKWTIDINPILEKVIKGDNTSSGWGLQYSAAAVYRLNERYHPRLELFGDFGPVQNLLPQSQQIHLLSPAVEMRLGQGFNVLAGIAFGLTEASEQRLIRLKLEKEFY